MNLFYGELQSELHSHMYELSLNLLYGELHSEL